MPECGCSLLCSHGIGLNLTAPLALGHIKDVFIDKTSLKKALGLLNQKLLPINNAEYLT
jgi:hypothetical protein